MKQYISFLTTLLLIISLYSVNAYSQEKTDSADVDFRNDIHRTIYISADINPKLKGLNTTLGLIYDVNIYSYGPRKVSAFY